MSGPQKQTLEAVIARVADAARDYLAGLDERRVIGARVDEANAALHSALPEQGDGELAALELLIREAPDAAAAASGPRYFHFVTGGTTPAAFGADWMTTVLDQNAYTWVLSPLGVQLELLAMDWLRELFALPEEFGGIMTTGATMANYTAMAAARQWWGERHGVDVSENGLSGLPPMPVFSSGHVHASMLKVLSMLGVGRRQMRRFASDARGTLDIEAMRAALGQLDGAPAVICANAGEVNSGAFDPIEALADLAGDHGAWLHVDGAFGLFAAVSPRTQHLTKGIERADSVIADGHKWLNVPYDSGYAFVQDTALLRRHFTYRADYLPGPDDPRPTIGSMAPESSRRARALAVWATLRAYGRDGIRAMVEGHLDLAQRLAARVDALPDFERLAEVPLNIVCFRYNPGRLDEAELDELNRRLGEAIIDDGRVSAGTTLFEGRVGLRPAICNWRTTAADIDFFVDVVRQLAAGLR